jgi:predicted nicotinamide N-methyase
LELGAGTGLASIVAAKGGAKVLATDGSESVVSKLLSTFELNEAEGQAQVLWWGENDAALHQAWDYVLGADITYDEEICSSLAKTLALGLRAGGVAIVAATVRNEQTLEVFARECGRPISYKNPNARTMQVANQVAQCQ